MRYIFNGYTPLSDLPEHLAQIAREMFRVTHAIAYGQFMNAQGNVVHAIVTKEQGLLAIDKMLRSGLIDQETHTRVAVNVMNCPHLIETTSKFELIREPDDPGCMYALVTTMRACESPMRTKATIRAYIEHEVQEYRLHPHYAGRLLGKMMQSRLPDTLTRVSAARKNGDLYVVIHNNEGYPGEPLLFSARQAIDWLNQLISDELLPAGMYPTLKRQIDAQGLPETHETDEIYFHKCGRESALFAEFVH